MSLSLGVIAAALALAPTGPTNRALWVWHGDQLLADPASCDRFFGFLQAPRGDSNHRISVIFLCVGDPVAPKTASGLEQMITQAHRNSVRVDFLGGDASFAEPSKNAEGLDMVQKVIDYNRGAPVSARFDGVQFDVEPYALPGWPTPELRQGYLHLFEECEHVIKGSGFSLLLGAAIPRWFDNPKLNNLYQDVLDRVDYVAVMDYVDNPTSFVRDATNTVNYATKLGKQAWLGAEATELPTEPRATFYAKGNAAMESAFTAASDTFHSSRGFAGVAIEYYEPYAALRP
jgi:hypothetical protein